MLTYKWIDGERKEKKNLNTEEGVRKIILEAIWTMEYIFQGSFTVSDGNMTQIGLIRKKNLLLSNNEN